MARPITLTTCQWADLPLEEVHEDVRERVDLLRDELLRLVLQERQLPNVIPSLHRRTHEEVDEEEEEEDEEDEDA